MSESSKQLKVLVAFAVVVVSILLVPISNGLFIPSLESDSFFSDFSLASITGAQVFDFEGLFGIASGSQPTVDSISLNTSLGLGTEEEDLVPTFTVSDPENESIKNITQWYLNGSSYPVLHLPFESHSLSSSVAIDYSSTGQNGSVSGASHNATGGFDGFGSYLFDGGDQIDVSDSSEFDFSDEMTVMGWLKSEDQNANGTAFAVHGEAEDYAWLIWISGADSADNFAFYQQIGAGPTDSTGCAGPDGSRYNSSPEWNHIAATFDSGVVTLYYNGEFCNNATHSNYLTISDVSDNVVLGRLPPGSSFLDGEIDDFYLFDRALSAEQIAFFASDTPRISENEVLANETWQVCVTPNDGDQDGSLSCSNSVLLTADDNNATLLGGSQAHTTTNITLDTSADPGIGGSVKNFVVWRNFSTPLQLLYTPFDGGAISGGKARDYATGNDVNITVATYQSSTGFDGRGAYNFSLHGHRLYLTNPIHLPDGQPWSISFWLDKTSDNSEGVVMGDPTVSDSQIEISAGNVYFRSDTNTLETFSYNPDADPHFYALVADGAQGLYLYVDGEFVDFESGYTGIDIVVLGDGDSSISSSDDLQGTLDEVSIWNVSLTPEQVYYLHNDIKDVFGPSMTVAGMNLSAKYTPNNNAADGTITTTSDVSILSTDDFGFSSSVLDSVEGTDYASEQLDAIATFSSSISKTGLWSVDGEDVMVAYFPFDSQEAPTLNYATGVVEPMVLSPRFVPNGSFDGSGILRSDNFGNQRITLSSPIQFSSSDPWSVAFYLKKESSDNQGVVLGDISSTDSLINVFNTGIRFRNNINGAVETSYSAGTSWHHYVVSADGVGGLRFYVDGEFLDFIPNVNTGIDINSIGDGDSSTSSADDLFGEIDEVIIFNTTLTRDQVRLLYGNVSLNDSTNLYNISSTMTGATEQWAVSTIPNNGLSVGTTRNSNSLTIVDDDTFDFQSAVLASQSGSQFDSDSIAFTSSFLDDVNTSLTWSRDSAPILLVALDFNNQQYPGFDYVSQTTFQTVSGIEWLPTGGFSGDGALLFEATTGLNQYLALPTPINFADGDGWTIMFDLKKTSDNNYGSVLGSVGESDSDINILGTGPYLNNNDNLDLPFSGFNPDADWHRYTFVADGSGGIELYVDGAYVDMRAYSSGSSFTITAIGDGDPSTSSANGLRGVLDNVYIFNESLTTSQIFMLHDSFDSNEVPDLSIIDSSMTSPGESWSVSVTPNDNLVVGIEEDSNSLVISSSTNFSATANISSASELNTSTEDLTIEVGLENTSQRAVVFQKDALPLSLLHLPFDVESDPYKDFSGRYNLTPIFGPKYFPNGSFDNSGYYFFEDVALANQELELNETISFSSTDPWTVSFYLQKLSASEADGIILGDSSTSSNTYVNVRSNAFDFRNTAGTFETFSITTDADWHWYTLVAYGTGQLSLYLDGEYVSTGSVDTTFNINSIGDGYNGASAGQELDGGLDEVIVWNTSLTSRQIQAMRPNISQGVGTNFSVIDSSMTSVGDSWSVVVWPHDGKVVGNSSVSDVISILEGDDFGFVSASAQSSLGFNTSTEDLSVSATFVKSVEEEVSWIVDDSPVMLLNLDFDVESDPGLDMARGNNATGVQGPRYIINGSVDGSGLYQFASDSPPPRLDLDSILQFDSDEPWAVSMLLKKESDSSNGYAIGDVGSTDSLILIGQNDVRFANRDNAAQAIFANYNPDTQWHHYVLSANGAQRMDLYVDGEFVSSETVSTQFDITSIGDASSSGSQNCYCLIDSVVVWNTSLLQDQVRNIYINASAGDSSDYSTLSRALTSRGEQWSAKIVPHDFSAAGRARYSSNLTILSGDSFNLSSATMSSTSGNSVSADNLTASLTYGQDTNASGFWIRNGTPLMSLVLEFDVEQDHLLDHTYTYEVSESQGIFWYSNASFDGSGMLAQEDVNANPHVSINETITFTGADEWSVTAYVQKTSDSTNGFFAGQVSDTADFLLIDTADVDFRNTANQNAAFAYDADTAWHHYAFVANGTHMTLYVDGSLISTQTITTSFELDSIGDASSSTSQDCNCNIDQFILWDVALTAQEVASISTNASAGEKFDLLTIPSVFTSEGDTWSINATPNDGVVYGDSVLVTTNISSPSFGIVGNESNVSQSGVSNLNVTLANMDDLSQGYSDTQSVAFYDGNSLIMNFSHNFGQSAINMNAVQLTKTARSLRVNLSNQLLAGETKTLYLENDNFDYVCVKDAEISSVDEITRLCTGANETRFLPSECQVQTTRNGITCSLSGGTFSLAGLANSGTIGGSAPSISSVEIVNVGGNVSVVDNLTITLTNVSDADNDSVKNITDWRLNGTSLAVINMPFERINSTNTSNAKDYSQFSNNATEVSSPSWQEAGGYDGGGAYEFTGAGGYLSIADDASLLSQEFSVAMWVNGSGSQGDFKHVVGKYLNPSWASWAFNTHNYGSSSIKFYVYDGATDYLVEMPGVLTGSYTHIAASVNATHMTTYINGVQNDSIAYSGPIAFNAGSVFIGSYDGGFHFNGSIDELLVINRSLSAEQVASIYGGGYQQIVAAETSLGEDWQVCATPNDAVLDGDEVCSSNVTIVLTTDIPLPPVPEFHEWALMILLGVALAGTAVLRKRN